MTRDDALDRGRDAFGRQAWGEAYAQFLAADGKAPLEAEDLERLAVVAYLTGRDSDSAEVWARAHHACLRLGDPARAARCAFWLGLALLLGGEEARGGGWLARAQRVLDDAGADWPHLCGIAHSHFDLQCGRTHGQLIYNCAIVH